MATQEYVQLKVLMKEAKAALTNLQKEQFPFAYAKSLTDTAEGARLSVGVQTRREFTLHSEFIPRNIKKSGASKNDIRNWGYGEAAVFTGKRLDGWMGVHEWSGTKKPFQGAGVDEGKSLAIPARDLKEKAYKTRTGKVRVRWQPKTLLKFYQKGRAGFTKGKGKGRKGKPFIIRSGGSGATAMIVRRKSKQRYPLEILYIFKSEAEIQASWGFAKTVRRYVNFAFQKKFNRNMALAIATAK